MYYNDFGSWIRKRFPDFRVQKISIDAGFSCPNRDGRISSGGCTYCDNRTFNPSYCDRRKSITEQLEEGKAFFSRKYPDMKYLAYFQAYTNTYAKVELLRQMYEEALQVEDVVGIVIGTRPDCVSDELLDYLEALNRRTFVLVEYGIESANDETLKRINRGHDFACYQRTTRLARERGLKVCSHLIVGLPGEGQQHGLETLEKVVETGVDGIKLHPLHIVKGSIMAKAWQAGRLDGIELEAYTVTAGEMIRHTPPEVIYHRISASARRPTLLAPLWCENRWTGMVELDRYLNEQGAQGSALGRSWVAPQAE